MPGLHNERGSFGSLALGYWLDWDVVSALEWRITPRYASPHPDLTIGNPHVSVFS